MFTKKKLKTDKEYLDEIKKGVYSELLKYKTNKELLNEKYQCIYNYTNANISSNTDTFLSIFMGYLSAMIGILFTKVIEVRYEGEELIKRMIVVFFVVGVIIAFFVSYQNRKRDVVNKEASYYKAMIEKINDILEQRQKEQKINNKI